MHFTFSRILAIAFLVSAPLGGAQITIRVYDYAEIKPRLLHGARQQAAKTLERAGVASYWQECLMSEMQSEQNVSCARPVGDAVIQLRIHPRNVAKKIGAAGKQLGYSLLSDRGFSVIAGVYLARTLDFARRMELDAAMVLGYSMAHEIGHLLLESNSHTAQGIMRPTWGDRDFRLLAKTGVLSFTEDQGDRMKAQVAARLEHHSYRLPPTPGVSPRCANPHSRDRTISGPRPADTPRNERLG